MNKIITTITIVTFALLCACSKNNNNLQDQIKSGELIVTLEASNITQNSAVLWGYVNPMELIPGVEIGIIVSKAENPSVENGTKLVSVEIDNNNKFFVEARGLLN